MNSTILNVLTAIAALMFDAFFIIWKRFPFAAEGSYEMDLAKESPTKYISLTRRYEGLYFQFYKQNFKLDKHVWGVRPINNYLTALCKHVQPKHQFIMQYIQTFVCLYTLQKR